MKRVSLSWRLFAALLVATTLGSAFFAGASMSADVVYRQAFNQVLSYAPADFYLKPMSHYTTQDLVNATQKAGAIEGFNTIEIFSKGLGDLEGDLAGKAVVIGVQDNSIVNQGTKLVSGSQSLGVNESYLWIGSPDLDAQSMIGKVIAVRFTIIIPDVDYPGQFIFKYVHWNFTVRGAVSLSDRSLAVAREKFYGSFSISYYQLAEYYNRYYSSSDIENILLVNWEVTFRDLLNAAIEVAKPFSPDSVYGGIIASVDRSELIDRYDIGSALRTLTLMDSRLSVRVAINYNMFKGSYLLYSLTAFQTQLTSLRLAFLVMTIPFFIIAWYMGDTAAGLSFNLRRREIGLLSVRGFGRRSIAKLFVTESIIIGLLSGFIGFLIGTLVVSFMLGHASQSGSQVLDYIFSPAGVQSIALTVGFGIVLAISSVFGVARKAANIKTIDALKEYTYVEEREKPRGSKSIWLVFMLGAYKIIAWIIGFNVSTLLYGFAQNIILSILSSVIIYGDIILNFIGPILFLYGSTKLIMQGSVRFQRKVGSLGTRVFREEGMLATKNVQRNPGRNVTIAFLVALIVGYGFYAVGTSAANNDALTRLAYTDVGADISASITPSSNITYMSIRASHISGVSEATCQRTLSGYLDQGPMVLKAIDPEKWLQVAYYEEGWFRGEAVDKAFQSMLESNSTIILESGVARSLSLKINDSISITVPTFSNPKIYSFRIVGLFGPDSSDSGVGTTSYYQYQGHWSFIPAAFVSESGMFSATDQLLVRVDPAANITRVVHEIQSIQNVSNVRSMSSTLESFYSNYFVTGTSGVVNIGVVLAVVGASLETAIIALITLLERRRELALLSVRGMSFRQISSILMIELVTIVGFAVALGLLVGLVMVFGDASSSTLLSPLVTRRIVFPLNSTLLIMTILALVFAAVIIPILIAAKKALSRTRIRGG